MDFDGSNDYISFSSTPSLSMDEFSVSWWVKLPTSGVGAWDDWWGLQISGGGEYVAEIANDGALYMFVIGSITGAEDVSDSTPVDLRDGNWHHLVFTASDGANASKIYLDGSQVGSSVWAATASVTGFVIGARVSGTSNRNIRSAIDEFRIYDKALSGTEVTALYNSGAGLYGDPSSAAANLVAGWHVDENTGSSITDDSGNGYTGTLNNSPSWITGHIDEPSGDTTPPQISSIATSNVSSTGFTVTWTTDEVAYSKVEWGTTTSYGSYINSQINLVTSHSINITGLTASTTYHFRVSSKDAADNEGQSSDQTQATASGSDTTPPQISNIDTSSITSTGFTVTWTTNEAATSQVEYGTTTSYGSSTTLDTNLVTNHSVNVTGLSANTTYHFRVLSEDAAENAAQSSDQSETTASGSGGGPGYALDFDGSNDWLSISSFPSLGMDEFSVSWWVKVPTSGVGNFDDWWGLQISGGGEYVAEIANDGALYMFVIGSISGAEDVSDSTPVDLRDGNWHHLVFTASDTANASKIYLDGSQVGSNVWAATASVTGFVIGARVSDTSNRNIRSAIDEFRVYDKALSGTEVTALYNSGDGLYGDPSTAESDVVAAWHLDEGTGTTTADDEGSADGTLTNSPTWITGHIDIPGGGGGGTPSIQSVTPGDGTVFYASVQQAIATSATDPESDPMEYRIELDGSVVNDWSSSSSYNWTPSSGQVGSHTLTIKVRDDNSMQTSLDLDIFIGYQPVVHP